MEKSIKTNTISIVKSERKITLIQFFSRLLLSTILFVVTAFFTPNLSSGYIGILLFSIIGLSTIDFILSRMKHIKKTALSKAICGFVCTCLALYFVPRFLIQENASWIPPILGALVYGWVIYLLPKEF